ncbi:MAG: hypothetical protein N2036_00445 [Bryobacteraceae bacterium]|nr:hypothetical protein [Bryobacteraceae bacterium]
MRRYLLLPALALSLGWGLRGFIGGGPLGAMIPGAMAGLLLALLLRQHGMSAWLAACGAIGLGLGGQMTYGQTVGLSLRPETFAWAMLGFAVKGGTWGLAGGAVLGVALLRGRAGWSVRRFHMALALMLAATWAGWRFVNQPRLVYFSDPLHRPREEVWAGLLAGALAFLLAAARGPLGRLAWRFALWACAAGALGFPLGAAVQAWGRMAGALPWFDWWKAMEFTFGAGLGAGLGLAAWLSRHDLEPLPVNASARPPDAMQHLLVAAAAFAAIAGIEYRLELRFNYSAAAVIALAAALRSDAAARHIAFTVTAAAFVLDFVENKPALAGLAGWAVVAAAGAAAAAWIRRERPVRQIFAALAWAAVAVSLLKTFVPPLLASPGHLLTEVLFVLLAWLCVRRVWRMKEAEAAAAPAVAS